MKKFITQKKLLKINNINDKNLIKNISGAFLLKGMSLILALFTLPAYMRFFDNQTVLGVWFTILSVANWIFTFDVGIGNGLRNCLTKELVRGDKKRIKTYISSSYLMISIIALIMSVIGFAISPYVDWNAFFNVDSNVINAQALLTTVRIIFIGIMLQFVFKMIVYILYALQKSVVNNIITFLVSLLQLLAVVLMPSADITSNLFRLALVNAIVANVLYIIVTFIIFRDKQLKGCGVNLKYFEKSAAKDTVNIGLLFLWTQILHLLLVLTDDFLVTQFTQPTYEVEYSIYYRLFSLVSTVFMLALTPVWSAVTKAQEEKDHIWLNKIYRLSNKLTLVGILGEFILIAVLQFIVNIWLRDNAIDINYIYAIIFALYGSVSIVQTVQQTFAYGFGIVKLQCICYSIGVVVKFAIVYYGTQIWPDAWILVVLANFVVMLPYCVIQPHFIIKEINKLKTNEQ